MNNTHVALYSKKRSRLSQSSLIDRLRHRVYDPLSKIIFQASVAKMKVRIQKRDFPYFVHKYNFTWTNERTIEIPYFRTLIVNYSNSKILEIGNTLSHYQPISHTVIDKYEPSNDVQNVDVLDFKPRGKFELIFAISTLEHVGWHEKEKRATKAIEAIDHLVQLLSPKGKLVFSFPLGVNPALDTYIQEDLPPHVKKIFLRRKNRFNMWEETTYGVVKNVKYNTPFPNANAICIMTITRKK